VLSQSLPRSAEAYARDQRAEIGAAVSAAGRLWRRMGADFDSSYALIERPLLAVLDMAQERVATGAMAYIPDVLAETGQTRALTARYDIDPAVLVGTAGDGLGTDTLAYGAVTRAKAAVGTGYTTTAALASGGEFLSLAVGTLLSDTGRTAEKMAMNARPVTGWVRMLNPPSCGRCSILAGRREYSSAPMLRHPGCDCRAVPSSESVANDLTVDPRAYFDSLDEAGQARLMGSKANAQAMRDGADMNQLINAYRRKGSVRSAQVYGRNVKYTIEGTTRRGRAYSRMRGAGLTPRSPRLMPESIYQIATSKADADRLLRLYGWIL